MGSGASTTPEVIAEKTASLPDKVDLATFRNVAGASYSKQIFDAFKDGDDCITKERVVGMGSLVQKMHHIREKFDAVANAETHSITIPQLQQLMTEMEVKPKEEDFADPDGDRTLLFPEFLTLMMHRVQDSETEKELVAAFKVFDIDGDGYITVEELQKGMEQLGEPMSLEEAQQMIAEADENNDGRIDFMEYSRKMAH